MADTASLRAAWRRGATPPPDLDVVGWAERFRKLSKESSNGGRFRTSKVEVARGPMLWATEPGVSKITLMACTQLLKALDCAMLIPTPSGWTTMGEIQVGDVVFDEQGKTCRVIGTSDIKIGEACYRITFSDRAEVICDAGHLWQVDDNRERFSTQETRVAETREIAATFKAAGGKRNRYAVPVTDALSLPERDLPIPPYTLGAWLGDGHSAGARMTLHENDREVLDRIRQDGIAVVERQRTPSGVLTVSLDFDRPRNVCRRGHRFEEAGRTSDGYCLVCSRQKSMQTKWGREKCPRDPLSLECESLGRRMVRLGLRNAKRIPSGYLRASRQQRLALLQGLMDADGTVGKNGRSCFTTTSPELAADVQELMATLGLKPSVYPVTTRCRSKGAVVLGGALQISFTAYSDEPVFHLSRKRGRLPDRNAERPSETKRRRIVNVERVESRPVRCIMVDSPNHLFLCGREMIPTHNTTVIENILGRFIHLDPCPILAVLPKDDAAETFSKDRFAPMVRDTKVLRELFGEAKSRDAGATLTHKQFPGGHLTMVGASSPTNLAMRPIRLLVCDEIDKYPPSAGGEGPPIDLAEERQAEFKANSLTVLACSPTISGRSAIEASYEESDQRKAFVRCPHPGCGAWQPLEWEQVRFDKDANGKILPASARYECVACERPWDEAQRLTALRRIEWRQTAPFTCCGESQAPETWAPEAHGVRRALCRCCGVQAVPNDHAGGVASKLYAPKQTIRETVTKFARALRRGPEALKTFFNTQLARTWKEGADAPEWQDVYARRDPAFRARNVPLRALLLMGAADVQKDRIEVSIWGFGRNRERWLVEHRVLPGETNRPEVWAALAEMFDETWEHAGGAEIAVRDWGIDSSGFTAEVYAFVRSQAGRGNVHAIDGQDSYAGAYLGVGAKDANAAGKKLRRGLKTIRIGVSFGKQELMGCLALQRPPADTAFPAGFVHLPQDVTEDQVRQLTSEELITHVSRGRTRREWVVIGGRRNEVLDCAVYARGLAAMRGWDRWRETHWRGLEDALGIERETVAPKAEIAAPAVVAGSIADREIKRSVRRSRTRKGPARW